VTLETITGIRMWIRLWNCKYFLCKSEAFHYAPRLITALSGTSPVTFWLKLHLIIAYNGEAPFER